MLAAHPLLSSSAACWLPASPIASVAVAAWDQRRCWKDCYHRGRSRHCHLQAQTNRHRNTHADPKQHNRGTSSFPAPFLTTLLATGFLLLLLLTHPLDCQTGSFHFTRNNADTHLVADSTADTTAATERRYEQTFDQLIGTINTMYYDASAGAQFSPQELYSKWKLLRIYSKEGAHGIRQAMGTHTHFTTNGPSAWQQLLRHVHILGDDTLLIDMDSSYTTTQPYWEYMATKVPSHIFSTNDKAVQGLQWLVSTLHDPYSKYITQDEMTPHLHQHNDGFLGIGIFVQATDDTHPVFTHQDSSYSTTTHGEITYKRARYLPMVTAVTPDSPAERAGIVVGDRIVAVGYDSFLNMKPDQVAAKLHRTYSAYNYVGHPILTLAQPFHTHNTEDSSTHFRVSKLRLTTKSLQDPIPPIQQHSTSTTIIHTPSSSTTTSIPSTSGGDATVHYQLITPQDSILNQEDGLLCGYIRITLFSRASTRGFVEAVHALEAAKAQVYIIDLRNNYGGILQEALITAASLLHDPHYVLCYTMNSRGGFTPHDVAEYIMDRRYPGYLLSKESPSMPWNTMRQDPYHLEDSTHTPSSYASFHEQRVQRGIHVGYNRLSSDSSSWDVVDGSHIRAQKKIVLLVNEGTASSAEAFASALRDNGRVVAMVGSNTFGKGLIQHTFPMPDGGGLKLTVAEYLTPKLRHVTKVGNARYDPQTGAWVGGIQPDVYCSSAQGIPRNIGADICVGKALDILRVAEEE